MLSIENALVPSLEKEFQNFRISEFLYLIMAYHKNTFVCLNTAITRINKTETSTGNTNSNKHDEKYAVDESYFGCYKSCLIWSTLFRHFSMNFGISNDSCLSFVYIRNTNRCLSSMNLKDVFRWIAALKNFSLSSLFILQAIRQCISFSTSLHTEHKRSFTFFFGR